MKTSLTAEAIRETLARLDAANSALAGRYPGAEKKPGRRQPVHTVYGGAHLFRFDTAARLGRIAKEALQEYAPDDRTLARALGFAEAERLQQKARGTRKLSREKRGVPFATTVYDRVIGKLDREPVEDFRIDFEDGYGIRPDQEEDRHAEAAAAEVARGAGAGTLPPFIGIRIKPLSTELRERSVRTLDIFVSTMAQEMRGGLPANFVVTLAKIAAPEQVAALVALLKALESKLKLESGALRFEMMIETPQAFLGPDGRSSLPLFLDAAEGRCTAAHFGPYDFSGSCGITAAYQEMRHPVCDFARHVMLVAFAGTGVAISDSCTTTLPVPIHRATPGKRLSPIQRAENRAAVHRAWKLHYEDIRHSLREGFYQGWDVHPAQLPTRYAAIYAFFLEALDSSAERLRNFLEKAAQATRVGEIFDDAATGQGLLNFFLRAVNSGAITEEEAAARSGLTGEELRNGSLITISKARKR